MRDAFPITTSVRIPARTWAALRALAHNTRPRLSVSKLVSQVMEDIVDGRIPVSWLDLNHLPSDETLQAAVEMRHPEVLIPRRVRNTDDAPPASPPATSVMEIDEEDLDVEVPRPELPTEVRGITGRWNKHLPRGFVVSFQDLAIDDPRVKANAALVATIRKPADIVIALGFLEEGKIDPRQFRELVGQSRLREFTQDEGRWPVGSEGREKLLAMSYADMRRDQAALIDVARAEEPKLSVDEEMLPPRAKFQAMVDRGVDRGKLKDFLVLEFETKHCPRCGEADLNGEPSFFGLVNPDGRVKCSLCRAFMHAGKDLPIRS